MAEGDSTVRPAPDRWNIGSLTGTLLAAVVLARRPSVFVEVGVANGTSTRIILAAMELNQRGVLHSFDIDARCANVAGSSLSARWKFNLLPNGRVASLAKLSDEIAKLGPIECWFSDADHTFTWQKFEWQLALSSLARGGLLIADDIYATPAWPVVTGGRESFALVDHRKVTGIAQPDLWASERR